MFYREAGQFKTSYAADMAIFPLRQDRIGLAVDHRWPPMRSPSPGNGLPAPGGNDPVPGLLARRDRAQPSHRLCRPALARHRRLHGRRGLRLLQAHDRFPGRERHRLDSGLGLLLGRDRRAVRAAVACASRASISRSRRSRRSSSCNGASSACPGSTITTSRARSRRPLRTLFGVPIVGADRDLADALSRGPDARHRC